MKFKLKIANMLLASTILAPSVLAEEDLFPEKEQRVGYYYNGRDVFEEFSKTVIEGGIRRSVVEERLGIPRHKGAYIVIPKITHKKQRVDPGLFLLA